MQSSGTHSLEFGKIVVHRLERYTLRQVQRQVYRLPILKLARITPSQLPIAGVPAGPICAVFPTGPDRLKLRKYLYPNPRAVR